MRLPPEVTSFLPQAVCKLRKSLHGLKQVARQWYPKLAEVLYTWGYKHSSNDYSLFYKKSTHSVVFLAIYVDDILLTGDDDVEMTALKAYLDDTFKIKDLGPIHWIEVLPTVGGLILT